MTDHRATVPEDGFLRDVSPAEKERRRLDYEAALTQLPRGIVVSAFERGVSPERIAGGFQSPVRDVITVVRSELTNRGLTEFEIAERFGEVWGLG